MSEEAALNLELLTHQPCSLLQVNDEMEVKQMEIVGTAPLYHRLDQSLRYLRIEPLFIREQWALYSWRCQYFEQHFPDALWGPLKTRTLAFLVCCKFDLVIDLALRSDLGVRARQELFVDTFADKPKDDEHFRYSILSRYNEKFSITAFNRFDINQVKTDFDFLYHENFHDPDLFELQEDYPLSFGDVPAMVAELCPSRVQHPKTLQEIAIKKVLKEGISMEEMSRDLQEKSVVLLSGKIGYDDEYDGTEKDVYDQDDYDEYGESRFGSSDQMFSDQELKVLKRVVRGKGLRILRKVRFHSGDIS